MDQNTLIKCKKFQIQAAEERQKNLNSDFLESKIISTDAAQYAEPEEPHWLFRRIFILTWIRSYDRDKAVADFIAGLTLGLTIIPQSIAYASLAGLSSEYGLYSAFAGSIIYVFFGTVPQVSIGPTSLMALMVLQFCADKPIQFTIVLAFLAGLVELLMGVFKLGFVVNFIPAPVNKAFTSATATIVVLAQIKNLLGIKIKGIPSPSQFINGINISDAIMGFICIIVLLTLRQLSQINFKSNGRKIKQLKKLCWYISISRNALTVFLCAIISFIWIKERSYQAIPFALSAKVESAAITLKLPPFVFNYNNVTYVFSDIVRELGSGIVVVPIVAVLANVAIAKAFVKDAKLDASQEMLSLGLCNLVGSLFSAMPTCGAFTRSAVSQSSGVRTPMAGIYTGLIVISALSILTPYFQYIPKATLSAVLIAAVVFMIDLSPIKNLWRSNKKDFFSWIGCFIVCLLCGVEMGLFFGIIVNMIFILLRLGNPKVDIFLTETDGVTYVYCMPLSDIYYSGVDYLRGRIRSACILYRNDFPIVLDCHRFMQFDATFVDMLSAVAKELNENNVQFVLHRMNLKLQEQIYVPNVSFTNGLISGDDFKQKK
ncbi:sodium-independent sulfate anion transporter isoform X2 [Teleopsis dalmanni]|uniref:sodium-independent sulfate anion transporter isoform X2 n=1 Tax=Teleopsis dalmanni TaxID=139649 RepID=UPI0018CEE9AF|nr:sodium-independent sulfate anion transporter isoform X2 [Teleopsis dalmanni]